MKSIEDETKNKLELVFHELRLTCQPYAPGVIKIENRNYINR